MSGWLVGGLVGWLVSPNCLTTSFYCFVGFPPPNFNMHFTDLKLMKSELRTEKKAGFSFRKLKKEKLSDRIFLNPRSPQEVASSYTERECSHVPGCW